MTMTSLCQALPLNRLADVAATARDLASICDAITDAPHDFINSHAAELAMVRLVQVMQEHAATLTPLMQAAAHSLERERTQCAA